MATDSDNPEGAAISCSHCEETFEKCEEHDEHLREAHDIDPEEGGRTAEEAAVANTEAAASTGSITEETNRSPSAAEPGEAAGPSGSDDTDPDLDHDDS